MSFFFSSSKLRYPVTGGLVLPSRKKVLHATPRSFDVPPKGIGNWEYLSILENQGDSSMCAAYSLCQILQSSFWRERNYRQDFSEFLLYKNSGPVEREGRSLEDVLDTAASLDLSQNLTAGVPTFSVRKEFSYATDIPFMIHRFGLLLVGLQITAKWTSTSSSGEIKAGGSLIGGHAVVLHSFIPTPSGFIAFGANSWGTDWGKAGHFSISSELLEEQFIYGYGLRISWPSPEELPI